MDEILRLTDEYVLSQRQTISDKDKEKTKQILDTIKLKINNLSDAEQKNLSQKITNLIFYYKKEILKMEHAIEVIRDSYADNRELKSCSYKLYEEIDELKIKCSAFNEVKDYIKVSKKADRIVKVLNLVKKVNKKY